MPHGNADVERSFSYNKNTVTDCRFSLDEHTIGALRLVKDGIKCTSGSATAVHVNQDMISRTRAAYRAYKAYLEEQARLEQEKKKRQDNEKARQLEIQREAERKENRMKEMRAKKQKIEAEEDALDAEEKKQHECLKNTEAILKEAGEKLSEGLTAKDMEKASVAQAMLEVANKRVAAANRAILEIQNKRSDLHSRKRKLEYTETSASKQRRDK